MPQRLHQWTRSLSFSLIILLIGGIVPLEHSNAAAPPIDVVQPPEPTIPYLQEKLDDGYSLDLPDVPSHHDSGSVEARAAQTVADAGVVSDDFNQQNLDLSLWTVANPFNVGHVKLVGAGTGSARLSLTAPEGIAHDPWNANNALLVKQAVTDGDFEVIVKFTSRPNVPFQQQGILVEQDSSNWLRFEMQYDGSGMRLFAAKTVNGSSTSIGSGAPRVLGSPTSYLRLNRTNNDWLLSYSIDGTSWEPSEAISVSNESLVVSALGPYAGNAGAGGSTAPGFTAEVDYFYNSAAPGTGDGAPPPDTTPPFQHALQRDADEDSVTVRWFTDEPATGRIRYGPTVAYGSTVVGTANQTAHEVTIPGLVPGNTYHYQVESDDDESNRAQSEDFEIVFAPNNVDGPNIFFWYGEEQSYGAAGDVQPWVNILGNASDPDGVARLEYQLNGGPVINLSRGPDGRRLQNTNDFNIDLATGDLAVGSNTISVTAYDAVTPVANSNTRTMKLTYEPLPAPLSLPYTIDWSSVGSVSDIDDVAHVVDGKWRKDSLGVRTSEPGYDRLIGFGDTYWNDYEVTVPFRINEFGPASNGVGVLLRWNGHTDYPVTCPQPKCGYLPLGVIAWHNNGQLQLYANNGEILASKPRSLAIGVVYNLKARAETTESGATYRMKVWESGQSEPSEWDISGQHALTDPQRGSASLVAHNADASFGNVNVTQVGSGQNNPPVANDDSAFVAPGASIRIDVLANDTDAGGLLDPTTVEIRTDASKGTTSVNPETGEITYAHAGTVAESDSFTYRVRDDEDAWSNDATVDLTISTETPDAARSDDFNACTLDDMWSVVDPFASADYGIEGAGTGDAILRLSMPSTKTYQKWGSSGNESLRLTQAAPNDDFQVEAHFKTLPTGGFDDHGIIVVEDDDNWLRFDIIHRETGLMAFMGSTINGANQARQSIGIPADRGRDLRVTRSVNSWMMEYKDETGAWTTAGVFTQPIEVNQVGVSAANTSGEAFTVDVDYFFNSNVPIIPEDGQLNTITVFTEEEGTVDVSPAAPMGYYACGDDVTLTAQPASGYQFDSWSGDRIGETNPISLTIGGPATVTATFALDADTTSPVIVLNGDNPYQLTYGGTYEEPGYTATDDRDGDITSQVTVSGDIDPTVAGSYFLTYAVSDAAGNPATARREVQVLEQELETIFLPLIRK